VTPIPRASGPLLSRTNWQMAPGERAALEGLLATVKPPLAIEIGTAQGGSLERIATHGAEVHTFDFEAQVDEPAFPNVTFHDGDNHVLLAGLLDDFERAGRNVDFVLIDADHSTAGVRQDLEDVLTSSAVRETFIVMHQFRARDRSLRAAFGTGAWRVLAPARSLKRRGRERVAPALRRRRERGS